ncbi:extracellular solute-binding protein [Biostraticola tofi]|uniref:Microcin C transport system substrate-binding protein n=1 Tax=Biostraticola tofi TaxID=466109 RepID=A0A4R3Z4P0_9GAMM|nr:extracellular solute-binding protein [Biostraticola tofi]TCV98949.1 microcin C transport system substrate-binding protein [Biostraticola tofi]
MPRGNPRQRSTLAQQTVVSRCNVLRGDMQKLLQGALLWTAMTVAHAGVPTVHGLSLYDQPALPADFTHFPYVNPDAPKGGTLTRSVVGSFDSTNPMIILGTAARGMSYLGSSLVYDTLLTEDADEPFSGYGLVASGIRLDASRRWVEFDINPAARFSDGHPLTAQDVKFSFELLRSSGMPLYRSYYADVVSVTLPQPNTIRFDFAPHNSRELPLILGQFPILPQHIWQRREFTKPTLQIPVGSGPYRLIAVNPGARVIYQRNEDYWARDLPVNRGRFNPQRIIYDYYRDDSVALEAFLAGQVDYRLESSAARWENDYRGPAMQSGAIRKITLARGNPAALAAWVLNLRRPLFQDRRLREALNLAFDFDTINRLFFYGSYQRTASFFDESEMAASALPSGKEREILASLGDSIPTSIMHTPLPSDNMADGRQRLAQALEILMTAGYTLHKNQLFTPAGRPVNFELLISDGRLQRAALPYLKNLSRIGIHAGIKLIDNAQYQVRLRHYDYDAIYDTFGQSNSPGNEQRYYWKSEYADVPHSHNTPGIRNPAVDSLVEILIRADSRDLLVASARALDRVLRFNHYLVPLYHASGIHFAYWQQVKMPRKSPRYGIDMDAWWIDPNAQ